MRGVLLRGSCWWCSDLLCLVLKTVGWLTDWRLNFCATRVVCLRDVLLLAVGALRGSCCVLLAQSEADCVGRRGFCCVAVGVWVTVLLLDVPPPVVPQMGRGTLQGSFGFAGQGFV